MYNVSKFAFAGFSDSMRRELAPFGIKDWNIKPGCFAASLLIPGHLGLNPDAYIPDYKKTNKNNVDRFQEISGKQMDSPKKSIVRIMEAVIHEELASGKAAAPPLRLFWGRVHLNLLEIFLLHSKKTDKNGRNRARTLLWIIYDFKLLG